jgi:hypothetical protein
MFEGVALLQEGQMALGVQAHQGASEEVELDSEFGGETAVDEPELLVGCKDVFGVSFEVKNGDEVFITDPLDPGVGEVSLLI